MCEFCEFVSDILYVCDVICVVAVLETVWLSFDIALHCHCHLVLYCGFPRSPRDDSPNRTFRLPKAGSRLLHRCSPSQLESTLSLSNVYLVAVHTKVRKIEADAIDTIALVFYIFLCKWLSNLLQSSSKRRSVAYMISTFSWCVSHDGVRHRPWMAKLIGTWHGQMPILLCFSRPSLSRARVW
jgi:hypothetical protein